MPSALAVLRFTMRSNFVGCSKANTQRPADSNILSLIKHFQSCLGSNQIVRVETLAKKPVNLAELRAILVGAWSQLGQTTHTQAKPKLKGFGVLLARDLKALAQTTLRLIKILA